MTEYTPKQIRQAAAVVRALEPGDETSLEVEFRLRNWADRIETAEKLIDERAKALFYDLHPDQDQEYGWATMLSKEMRDLYRKAVRNLMSKEEEIPLRPFTKSALGLEESREEEDATSWQELSAVPASVNKVYDKDNDTVIRDIDSPFGWKWINYTMLASDIPGLAPYSLHKSIAF